MPGIASDVAVFAGRTEEQKAQPLPGDALVTVSGFGKTGEGDFIASELRASLSLLLADCLSAETLSLGSFVWFGSFLPDCGNPSVFTVAVWLSHFLLPVTPELGCDAGRSTLVTGSAGNSVAWSAEIRASSSW
jgi:hypothetical protein